MVQPKRNWHKNSYEGFNTAEDRTAGELLDPAEQAWANAEALEATRPEISTDEGLSVQGEATRWYDQAKDIQQLENLEVPEHLVNFAENIENLRPDLDVYAEPTIYENGAENQQVVSWEIVADDPQGQDFISLQEQVLDQLSAENDYQGRDAGTVTGYSVYHGTYQYEGGPVGAGQSTPSVINSYSEFTPGQVDAAGYEMISELKKLPEASPGSEHDITGPFAQQQRLAAAQLQQPQPGLS